MNRNTIVTLVALVLLVVALSSFDGFLPDVGEISDTMLIVTGVLLTVFISKGSCCRSRCRNKTAQQAE